MPNRLKLSLIVVAVALFGMTSWARAATVYSYTSDEFLSVVDSPLVPGTYTTSDRITGSFTLAAPLPASTSFFVLTPLVLDYSFSDGRNTLTDANSTGGFAAFTTDSNGLPIAWSIGIEGPEATVPGQAQGKISTVLMGSLMESGSIKRCTILFENACLFATDEASRAEFVGIGGTWTKTTTPPRVVPLPAALPLFGAGLAAIGLIGWRRQRRTKVA